MCIVDTIKISPPLLLALQAHQWALALNVCGREKKTLFFSFVQAKPDYYFIFFFATEKNKNNKGRVRKKH